MVLVDYLAGEFVYTEKLNVPQGLTVRIATQSVESWDRTVFAHSANTIRDLHLHAQSHVSPGLTCVVLQGSPIPTLHRLYSFRISLFNCFKLMTGIYLHFYCRLQTLLVEIG